MTLFRLKNKKFFCIGFLSLLLTVIGLILYGRWEARCLECNTIPIPEQTLPGLKGLRILVISDIHDDDEQLGKAVDEGLKQSPDLAFILGDLVNGGDRIARTRRLIDPLKKLSSSVPTYACIGNHDMGNLPMVTHILNSAKIPILRNSFTIVDIPRLGKKITLAGLGEWWDNDSFPERCLKRMDNSSSDDIPVILLSHTPAGRNEAKDFKWNLMLSGHTHGGQIRYPITNQPVFHREGEVLTEGLHRLFPGKSIFITRGIGSAWNLRFNCPPEFNILTVH